MLLHPFLSLICSIYRKNNGFHPVKNFYQPNIHHQHACPALRQKEGLMMSPSSEFFHQPLQQLDQVDQALFFC